MGNNKNGYEPLGRAMYGLILHFYEKARVNKIGDEGEFLEGQFEPLDERSLYIQRNQAVDEFLAGRELGFKQELCDLFRDEPAKYTRNGTSEGFADFCITVKFVLAESGIFATAPA
ncbi:MAG: hypothetical protein WDN09_01395 [bacterium]